MTDLREELRPLVPLFTAARQALDQTRWRLGMPVDDLVGEIVLAVCRELSGPSTAVLDQLRATQALAESWELRARKAEAERDKAQGDLEAYTADVLSVHAQKNAALERAGTTIARVRKFAEEMRDWCSPYGVAVVYADRLQEVLDKPTKET